MSVGSDRSGRAAERRPPTLLLARDVEKRYGHVVALGGVAVEVGRGEVVGLVGSNGSGKTTLLHVVAGLVEPDRGTVAICGASAGSSEARRHVALVPDEPAGFDELTVAEHVALLGALYRGGEAAAARAEGLLRAFDLGAWRHAPVGALSHGLRRQAALVAALAVGPSLLVVDEAAATLDPRAVDVLAAVLRAHALRAGAVLLATQDRRFADSTCDRVLVLSAGSVVAASVPGTHSTHWSGTRTPEAAAPVSGRSAEGGACVATH